MNNKKLSVPDVTGVPVRVQVLRILEKMYDGKWRNLRALAKETALNEQVTRNALGDMVGHGWVEHVRDGNAGHYRLTDRSLARESRAAINKINELAGALLAAPERNTDNAENPAR